MARGALGLSGGTGDEVDLVGDDFSCLAVVAILVGELACTQFAADGYLGALGQVVGASVGRLAEDCDVVPFGVWLPLAVDGLALVGCNAQVAHAHAGCGCPLDWVAAQVATDDYGIHVYLLGSVGSAPCPLVIRTIDRTPTYRLHPLRGRVFSAAVLKR